MLMDQEMFAAVKNELADQYEKSAKVLRELNFAPIMVIEAEDNTFVGEIMSFKDGEIHIKLLAAREIDYKVRKLSSRSIKRRTYPLPIWRITNSKPVNEAQVPLYINFKYLSPQFKNKYLR
jgi:hypothetical protein